MDSQSFCRLPSDGSAAQIGKAHLIVRVLQSHAGVREATVLQIENAGWIGFVVADDKHLDNFMKRGEARELALKRWQKSFDLTHFTKHAVSKPVGLNIQGWNSSYTGEELPEADMREWVQVTVSKILEFAPKSVYEIGCGTGMLLLRVAPVCQRYVGVDFSPATLDRVRAQLKTVPTLDNSVELLQRMADNFTGFDRNSFDTVVLNSVAQFFPNSSYLTQVLDSAIDIVRPGGKIFAGDMQSLPLRNLFLSSVELFRSDDNQTLMAIVDRVRRRILLEPWLFVSPAYFLSLAAKHKKLSRVEIEPRPGNADNEVTRYRYNAILHVGDPETQNNVPFEDWREHRWDLEEIRRLLQNHASPFGITNVPNARVELDVIALEELKRTDVSMTARELKCKLGQTQTCGIHPQDLVDLAKSVGLEIRLSWAACRRDGSYDAAFFPPKSRLASHAICWPQANLTECLTMTSWPGQSKLRSNLVDQISAFCKSSLPPELVPAEIYLVDTLPSEGDQAFAMRVVDGLNSL
jgi:SAM-dependent methyltransferase